MIENEDTIQLNSELQDMKAKEDLERLLFTKADSVTIGQNCCSNISCPSQSADSGGWGGSLPFFWLEVR